MSIRVHPWFLGFLHAALFALAFPPFDLWFFAFVAPVPLTLLAIRAISTRQALIVTCITQFLMWLWLVRWIITVTVVGYPFLALYMSIWPAVFLWIIRRAAVNPTFGRWPMTLLLPILWVGVEFFRGDVLFYGYPWYLLGHPLIAVPAFVQSADLFGTYFISFLAAMTSGVIVDVFRARAAQTSSRADANIMSVAKSPRGGVLVVFVVFAANIGYGVWRMNQSESLTPGPRLLAIQTSLPQSNKIDWRKNEREAADAENRAAREFIALTRQALENTSPNPDLIVWPETMVPGRGFEPQTIAKLMEMQEHGWDLSQEYRWPLAMADLQRELGIPMILGADSWIGTSDKRENGKIIVAPRHIHNSAYLVQNGPPYQRYDKYFLTPFGETMPYISGWPWLERMFLTIGVSADLSFNLDSNPDIKLLQFDFSKGDAARHIAIATPICFEDTVGRFCRQMMYKRGEKRGDLFVNISNDGWFAFSEADRKLHAQIARFRCIENRVPMVRCVNTGLSVSIDSCGRLRGGVGGDGYGKARQSGWLAADVAIDSRRTLYGRTGEIWPVTCLVATAGMLLLTFVGRRNWRRTQVTLRK